MDIKCLVLFRHNLKYKINGCSISVDTHDQVPVLSTWAGFTVICCKTWSSIFTHWHFTDLYDNFDVTALSYCCLNSYLLTFYWFIWQLWCYCTELLLPQHVCLSDRCWNKRSRGLEVACVLCDNKLGEACQTADCSAIQTCGQSGWRCILLW